MGSSERASGGRWVRAPRRADASSHNGDAFCKGRFTRGDSYHPIARRKKGGWRKRCLGWDKTTDQTSHSPRYPTTQAPTPGTNRRNAKYKAIGRAEGFWLGQRASGSGRGGRYGEASKIVPRRKGAVSPGRERSPPMSGPRKKPMPHAWLRCECGCGVRGARARVRVRVSRLG